MIRFLRRGLMTAAFFYAVTIAGIVAFCVVWQNPDAPSKADVIVCLSAGVEATGEIDRASVLRAETCADLYLAGVAPQIVFTGGNRKSGQAPSSVQMADVAMARGVALADVQTEQRSESTLQNALFTKPFLKDAESIVLVTEAFHLPRSMASFWATTPHRATLYSSTAFRRTQQDRIDWYMIHRETLAVWFNLARFTLWRSATALGISNIDHWLT